MEKIKIMQLAKETHIGYNKLLDFFQKKKNNLSSFELHKLDKAMDLVVTDANKACQRIKTLLSLENL